MESYWNPYDRPEPRFACVTSEPLLIQAWKKSFHYIRTRNWYADALEMDCSAAQLECDIHEWRDDCCRRRTRAFKPRPMHVVPAPKCFPWNFRRMPDGGTPRWAPVWETNKRPYLRPLAHLRLRDQVLATACMICVADVVETAQGNPDVSTEDAVRCDVSSYGNRLHCDWKKRCSKDSASFNWGNSGCYRKYSADYQAFLKRPKDIMAEEIQRLEPNWELGVVSLDLSGFYDNIDRQWLLQRLRVECEKASVSMDELFWKCMRSVFCWSWAKPDSTSVGYAKLFKGKALPKGGLPQGLVASGFLSNIAMLDFDEAMRCLVKQDVTRPRRSQPFRILDYCRYVDDMRLVVKWRAAELAPATPHGENLPPCNQIAETVDRLLKKHSAGQKCNSEKTKYTPYRELVAENSPSAVMAWIQDRHSGPSSLEELRETGLALEGLLQMDCRQQDDQSGVALGSILHKRREVRDDTIIRFASYRQLVTLRHQREMMPIETQRLERGKIDAEIDKTARRLIHLWSLDPSLTIVLRHAFNLKPCPRLLSTVLEAIDLWIRQEPAAKMNEKVVLGQRVCQYVLADLLRAALIETGRNCSDDALPDDADLEGYLECLADYVVNLLEDNAISLPWYLMQPAVMFLCQRAHPPKLTTRSQDSTLLSLHRYFILAYSGTLHSIAQHSKLLVPLVIVAHQLGVPLAATVSRLARWLDTADYEEDEKLSLVRQIYNAAPRVYGELVTHEPTLAKGSTWCVRAKKEIAGPPAQGRMSLQSRVKSLSLSRIISSPDNPFRHEAAVLQLLQSMLIAVGDNETELQQPLSPNQIICIREKQSFSRLQKPRCKAFRVTIDRGQVLDPRYEFPDWQERMPNRKWKLNIGRLLRAAITGLDDHSALPYRHDIALDSNIYRGITTSWYKRSHGLFNGSVALTDGEATITPWLSELLSGLLLWPGSRTSSWLLSDVSSIREPAELLDIVERRLGELWEAWGHSIESPVYIHPVRVELKKPQKLTVCLVQTVRPFRKDIEKYSARLDDRRFRHVRRNHLASMLGLALRQLGVRRTYEENSQADLVVMPEYAVHQDDIDLVERFSDKTRAIVFSGLALRDHPSGKGLANTGMWIIPNRDSAGRRTFIRIPQGKHYVASPEQRLGVDSWRPCQQVIELHHASSATPLRISAALCYDATDLALAHDLRNVSDMLIVSANNQDIETFDRMASAWGYHMYQHVLVVNSGEFGGTFATAPYKERFERVLVHNHGGKHASVSVLELDLNIYESQKYLISTKELKTPPAGYRRH